MAHWDTVTFFPNVTYETHSLVFFTGDPSTRTEIIMYRVESADSLYLPILSQHGTQYPTVYTGDQIIVQVPGDEMVFTRVGN